MSLGVAWVSLVAMVYTHRGVREDFRPRQLMLLVAVSLALYGAVWGTARSAADLKRYAVVDRVRVMTAGDWLAQGWRTLPDRRFDVAGQPEEDFGLQWACGPARIAAIAGAAGWQPAPEWTLQSTLTWLQPQTPLADHPVLPRYDRGNASGLVFVRASSPRPDEREVLRLWRSEVRLRAVNAGAPAVPVWYGAAYRETHPSHGWLPGPAIRRVVQSPAGFAAQLPADVWWQQPARASGQPEGRAGAVPLGPACGRHEKAPCCLPATGG